jgi:hypothetical protein
MEFMVANIVNGLKILQGVLTIDKTPLYILISVAPDTNTILSLKAQIVNEQTGEFEEALVDEKVLREKITKAFLI